MISITFDTDHMDEENMATFMNYAPIPGPATFFCVHPYRFPKLQNYVHHEYSIHPILDHDLNWIQITDSLRSQVNPDTIGVRAHSCTFSQNYAIKLANSGFRYTSSTTRFFESGIKPFLLPWGIWEMPVYYQDNADMTFTHLLPSHIQFDRKWIHNALSHPGLFVFLFHPAHILMNTFDMSTARQWIGSGRPPLTPIATEGGAAVRGAGTFYMELVRAMQAAGQTSTPLKNCIPQNMEF